MTGIKRALGERRKDDDEEQLIGWVFAVKADADLGETFRNVANVTISNVAMKEASAELDFHVHQDKGTSSLLHRPSESRRHFHSADRVVANRTGEAAFIGTDASRHR